MIKRYAIVRNNKIDNICLWDGITEWEPVEDAYAVEAEDNWKINGTLIDGVYADPQPPFIPPFPTNQ